MSAVPKAARKSGAALDDIEPHDEPKTRREEMEEAGVAIIVPPVSAVHLLDWLFDAGPCDFAMDRVPLGWGSIDAWATRTRTRPTPWEARLLRRLSAAWLAEGRRSEKPDCMPPSLDTMPVRDRRKLVDRKLAAIFG